MTRRSTSKTRDPNRDRGPSSKTVAELNATATRKVLDELDPTCEAWERQAPLETPGNYGIFCYFRDLGPTRTIAQAAELCNRSPDYLSNLQSSFKWRIRAAAWDAEQDRLFSIALIKRRRSLVERHVSAARKMMDKALQSLAAIEVGDLSPHALILLFDTAAKIERAALGMEQRDTAALSVTAAVASRKGDEEQAVVRVEVGVLHEQITTRLDEMLGRMTPDQIASGYAELESKGVRLDGQPVALAAAPSAG